MKKLIFLILLFDSCKNEIPYKHILQVNMTYGETYKVTSEFKFHDGCVTFYCIDPWDGEGIVEKTVCGNYTIEY